MRSMKAMFAAAVLLVLLGVTALPVAAAEIQVDSPSGVTVGEDATVTATITVDGEPVVNGEAALSFVGRLGGESGWVVVATGTTDENGSVTFVYPQRAVNAERMRVEYFGPDGQENAEFTVVVTDGPQLVSSEAGADLPIFGVWWIVVVLAIVWISLGIAVFRLVQLGRASDREAGPAKVIPTIMVLFVAVTAVGMVFIVFNRPQSHANLDPTAEFDRVPSGVVGADVGYTGLSGDELEDDLTGRELFVQAGCASCHGVDGLGAVVGGQIAGGEDAVRSVGAILDEVREGPKGMPVYSEVFLSDDDVAEIFAYLQAIDDS
jgi:amino acid transporter